MTNPASITADLAASLRAYRDRNFLTQAQLAKRLRVTTRSVQEYESGRALPRAGVRQRIARLFEAESERAA